MKGAYYCTYPSFVDYCRLIVRAKERNEFPAVLMFLTLSQKKKTQAFFTVGGFQPLKNRAAEFQIRLYQHQNKMTVSISGKCILNVRRIPLLV